MSKLIKGLFRKALINTISRHTPFGPMELDTLFESTNSIDVVIRTVEYALLNAVDLFTARDELLKQTYNNQNQGELLSSDGNEGSRRTK